MADLYSKPSDADVLASLQNCFPALKVREARFLSEGWDSWAYEAAGCIFRVPKHEYTLRSQAKERRLMPRLAPLLPLPVPDMEFTCDEGPGGRPFVGYRRIPGVPLSQDGPIAAPRAGAALGAFLRVLHSVPASDFADAFEDKAQRKDYGTEAQERVGVLYERVIREAFPLLSCEVREATKELFEGFLVASDNFDYEPSIVHGDLGREHVLVDPRSFEVTGVIDFGDACLGDPAGDFASIIDGGLAEALGPEGITAAVTAYGGVSTAFERRARFYRSLWPYHEVLGGLVLKDDDILESALKELSGVAKGRQPCP